MPRAWHCASRPTSCSTRTRRSCRKRAWSTAASSCARRARCSRTARFARAIRSPIVPLALGNALATSELPIKLEGTLQGHGEIRRTPQGELFGDVLIESESGSISRHIAAAPGDETQERAAEAARLSRLADRRDAVGPGRARYVRHAARSERDAARRGQRARSRPGGDSDHRPRARADSGSRAARRVRAAARERARPRRCRHRSRRHGAGARAVGPGQRDRARRGHSGDRPETQERAAAGAPRSLGRDRRRRRHRLGRRPAGIRRQSRSLGQGRHARRRRARAGGRHSRRARHRHARSESRAHGGAHDDHRRRSRFRKRPSTCRSCRAAARKRRRHRPT